MKMKRKWSCFQKSSIKPKTYFNNVYQDVF